MRNLPFRQKIAIEIVRSLKLKHSKSETDLWHWQKGKEEIEKILINEIYLCCGWRSKGSECSAWHSPLLLKPKFLWCIAQYPAIMGIKRKRHENIINKGLNWTASGIKHIVPRFLLLNDQLVNNYDKLCLTIIWFSNQSLLMQTVVQFSYRATCIFAESISIEAQRKRSPEQRKGSPRAERLRGLCPAVPGKIHRAQQGSRSVTPRHGRAGFTALHPRLPIPPCTSLPASPFPLRGKVWPEAGLPRGDSSARQDLLWSPLVSPNPSRCNRCWEELSTLSPERAAPLVFFHSWWLCESFLRRQGQLEICQGPAWARPFLPREGATSQREVSSGSGWQWFCHLGRQDKAATLARSSHPHSQPPPGTGDLWQPTASPKAWADPTRSPWSCVLSP